MIKNSPIEINMFGINMIVNNQKSVNQFFSNINNLSRFKQCTLLRQLLINTDGTDLKNEILKNKCFLNLIKSKELHQRLELLNNYLEIMQKFNLSYEDMDTLWDSKIIYKKKEEKINLCGNEHENEIFLQLKKDHIYFFNKFINYNKLEKILQFRDFKKKYSSNKICLECKQKHLALKEEDDWIITMDIKEIDKNTLKHIYEMQDKECSYDEIESYWIMQQLLQ